MIDLNDLSETTEEGNVVNTLQVEPHPANNVLDRSRFSTLHAAKRATLLSMIFVERLLRHFPPDRKQKIFSAIPAFSKAPDLISQINGPAMRATRMLLICNHLLSTCY
ncbi:hypothetical protein Q1695_009009 [Nippostrongylus brasiliensis]|nr:hypothetical protein Q1695_009009 [Nippostrongylus brasiliensis]